jgi:predicted nucleic acid-binding protein
MIVADSNLVAYLLIPGAMSSLAEAVLRRDAAWATPLLCRSELRNILTLYVRDRGMPLAQAWQTMERADRLVLRNEFAVPSDAVIQTASEAGISAYDAEFVVLAGQLQIPLVTCDGEVLRAFPRTAVHPSAFAGR